MKLSSWRLVKLKYAKQAMDGSGARAYGGRWNSPGTAMIYTSSTAALAAIEVLTHLTSSTRISFQLIEFQFEERMLTILPLNALPSGWSTVSPPSPLTQRVGDRWVREGQSCVFRVPSVHVPLGDSYLFNPMHRDFDRIELIAQKSYSFDRRLIEST